MFSQGLEERKLLIDELYQQVVGMGLNSHFPGPLTLGLWEEEAKRLIWCELENPNLNSVVIGSHNGGSEACIAVAKKYKNDNSKIISIDIKFGDFYELTRNRIKQRCDMELVKWEMDSSEFKDTYELYTNDNIGLVLIDGYHSYVKIIDDLEQVKPFLVSDSLVLFHDCSPKHIKRGIKLPEGFINEGEDFRTDEAISSILDNNENIEEYNIPIGLDCDRRREAQRSEYIRGSTSPFNSLFALSVKSCTT